MLTDAGPLAAFIDRRDQYHQAAQRAFAALGDEPLLTTCACFAEAMHLLGDSGGYRYQSVLLDMARRGLLQIHHLTAEEEIRAFALLEQYRDRPMDYADASLVAVAESRQIMRILTFDSDFRFYRMQDGATLEVLP